MSNTTITQQFLEAFKAKYSPEFYQAVEGETYLTFQLVGTMMTIPVRSPEARKLIRSIARIEGVQIRSSQMVDMIIEEIDSICFENQNKEEVFVRVAPDGDDIIFDPHLPNGQYIRINKDGFQSVKNSRVRFWKPKNLLSHPFPQKTTRFLELMRKFFNLSKDEELLLLLAFIVKCLLPKSGSMPILVIVGNKGDGKTTISRHIKSCVDNTSPIVNPSPVKTEDLVIVGHSTHLMAFDNISKLNKVLSDVFCQMSTGIGFLDRRLYTNNDFLVYSFLKPIILNGIDEFASRADLRDRCIFLRLKSLNKKNRISEIQFEKEFQACLPELLGGIFELISGVLRELPNVSFEGHERMTEYSRVGVAIERVLNYSSGTFEKVYKDNIKQNNSSSFWEDEICIRIHEELFKLLQASINPNGAAQPVGGVRITGVLNKLYHDKPLRISGLNKVHSVKGFSAHLNRISPTLLLEGIIYDDLGKSSRGKIIQFRFTPHKEAQLLAEIQEERRKAASQSVDQFGFDGSSLL